MADETPAGPAAPAAPPIPPAAPVIPAAPTRPPIPSGQSAAAQQQRQQYYSGYYNQRYYNYGYGVHTTQTQIPHQFSQTAEAEQQQRPIYIGVAGIAIFFGLFMIFSAFSQPKVDPDIRAQIQQAPNQDIRAIVFCDACESQLEAAGITVVASYPTEGALLVMGKGSTILALENVAWVKRIGKPT